MDKMINKKMARSLFFLSVLVLCAPAMGVAGPCVMSGLDSYIALGPTGCSIGDKTFTNFASTFASLGDATTNPSKLVIVSPTGGSTNPSLSFSSNFAAGANDVGIIVFSVGFQAIAPMGEFFTSSALSLQGVGLRGDGTVDAVHLACSNGQLMPNVSDLFPPPSTCSGAVAPVATISSDDPTAIAQALLPPSTHSVAILDSLQVLGLGVTPLANDARASGLLNTFSATGPGDAAFIPAPAIMAERPGGVGGSTSTGADVSTPEPASFALVALGLLWAAALSRKWARN